MKRALLTLTAALLCAGTTLAQNSATGSAVAAQPSATKQPAAAEIKPFGIGDKAPEFKVAKFVKGEPITGFEKGKTYVVEFWATWCGPCKESIPHLTKLAAEYKGKVTFVGVSVWEADQDRVAPFVTEWDKKMEYNVAMDDVPAYPEGVKAGTRQAQQHAFQNGTMSRTWMQGGGRDGIPSAFIVNGDGRIAWIGDPRAMDDVLSQVVAGKWDVEKAAAAGKAMSAFGAAMEAEEYDKAYDAVRGQIDVLDAMSLNDIAWTIVDPSGNVEKKDLDLALKAASRANEMSGNKDGAILDTLARVYFLKGDLKKAVDTETRAIENSPEALKAQLEPVLKEYKDALAKKPG